MTEKKNNEEITINFGKYLSALRSNPWLVVSLVLGVLLILSLFFPMSGGVGQSKVKSSIESFVNAQGSGTATVTDVSKEGNLYKANVQYQGQDIPVYVTLDGKYLITTLIPLDLSEVQNPSDTTSGAKVDVQTGDAPVLGSKDAPVTIVEFSDYQCPFCRKFWTETYSQLKKDYIDTGKVKLVFMDFPLVDIHPSAKISAEAARCVREKGGDAAYWKMHDKIFSESNILDSGSPTGAVTKTAQFTATDLKKWAKELGYNIDSCLDSGKYESAVMADEAYGQSLGVTGTPGFFVNGANIAGAVPYSVFQQLIEQELQ
jgi:protein-disulfide isomerase